MLAKAATETQARERGRGGRPSRDDSARLSDRILDVATELFLRHGFGVTSIEAVAKRAGISKRTFYHRFRSKEVLFEAVVRRLIQRWLPPFDQTMPQGLSLSETLGLIGGYMLKVALTPEALALHRMVIAEAQRFPGLARIMHELGAATGIDLIARLFEKYMADGDMRTMDARLAAEQFIMMVVTAPRRRALGLGAVLSEEDLHFWVEFSVTLFLDGSRAPPS